MSQNLASNIQIFASALIVRQAAKALIIFTGPGWYSRALFFLS